MSQKFAHSPSEKNPQTWHDLKDHLMSVANLCGKFGEKFNLSDFCFNIGLCHDLGKSTDAWQKYLLASYNNQPVDRVNHSMYGAVAVKSFNSHGAMLIAGHHGQIKNPENFKKDLDNFKESADISFVQSDYIFDHTKPKTALEMRMCFSALIDADRSDSEIFGNNKYNFYRTKRSISDKHKKSIDSFFAKFKKSDSPINILRDKVKEDCFQKAKNPRGFFTLTAPTGVGKTLSVMNFAIHHALANNMDRVIAIMPFTSIIQQNTKVYQDVFGESEVLEHHSNIIFDEDSQNKKIDFFRKINSDNWNSPIINTTFSQFFDSLFANRPARTRKLHNIANSVIIIDETQLISVDKVYDCIDKLKDLVQNFNCSIVFCTATPFYYEYWKIDATELCDDYEQIFEQMNRVEFKITSEDSVHDIISKNKQILCVVNTKKKAYDLFHSIEAKNVFHLSTNMTPKHRSEVLKKIKSCLSSGLECKVVATQLVECGVDLDFPVIVSEISPLPSLIQRAGRCNREGKLDKGIFYIYKTSGFPDSQYKSLSMKTWDSITNNLDRLNEPKFCQDYFHSIHDMFARSYKIDSINISELERTFKFEDSAKFRMIDENQITVIVDCDEELIDQLKSSLLEGGLMDRTLRQKIQNHSINLYENKKIADFIKPVLPEISSDFMIWTGDYSQETGVEIY